MGGTVRIGPMGPGEEGQRRAQIKRLEERPGNELQGLAQAQLDSFNSSWSEALAGGVEIGDQWKAWVPGQKASIEKQITAAAAAEKKGDWQERRKQLILAYLAATDGTYPAAIAICIKKLGELPTSVTGRWAPFQASLEEAKRFLRTGELGTNRTPKSLFTLVDMTIPESVHEEALKGSESTRILTELWTQTTVVVEKVDTAVGKAGEVLEKTGKALGDAAEGIGTGVGIGLAALLGLLLLKGRK